MKKTTLLLMVLTTVAYCSQAQTTIFLETFGTTQASRNGCTTGTTTGLYDPAKYEAYAAHDWSSSSHIWNSGVSYTQTSNTTTNAGNCDDAGTTLNIRTNNPSTTYTGASADGNLYFNADLINSFTINGINTSNYNNTSLSFGIYGKNDGDVNNLVVQYSTNGSTWTTIGATEISALSATKQNWLLVSGISIISSSTLSLKFSTPNQNATRVKAIEIRLDDIKITGTSTADIKNNPESSKKVLVVTDGLKLQGFTSGTIEIYSYEGKKVFASEYNELIQPNLPKGLYIIRVGNYRQKINL